MSNIGKRLMPSYLIKFMERVYQGNLPTNMGKRMVSRQFIAKIQSLYDRVGCCKVDEYSRRMVPEYLIEEFGDADYVEYTSESLAYTVATPEGALKYAELNEVGGMSYKCYQLLNIADVEETTVNGITYSVSDNTVCISGTAAADQDTNIALEVLDISAGKYASKVFKTGSTTSTTYWVMSNSASSGNLFQLGSGDGETNTGTTTSTTKYIRYRADRGSTFTDYNIKFMVVAGSTAPTEYQPYFTGIRDSAVTAVNELTIPAEVQALDGYGWGINSSVYNYIDYDNKKFVQKVARVDLGSLAWSYNSSQPNCFRATLNDIKTGDGLIPNCLLIKYIPRAQSGETGAVATDLSISIFNNTHIVFIHDNSFNENVSAFKTAMSGVYLYYELETPVETDISDYLDGNLIDVTNGTTFENEYEQAVPSTITYVVKA